MIGVHLINKYNSGGYNMLGDKTSIEEFADKVPNNTEIVLGYRENLLFNNEKGSLDSSCPITISMHGIALILNKKDVFD